MRTTIGNPNYQGPFGNTLLHSAVVSGDAEEVRRLLAAGADPGIRNREGRSALDAAVLLGHRQLYELLRTRPSRSGRQGRQTPPQTPGLRSGPSA